MANSELDKSGVAIGEDGETPLGFALDALKRGLQSPITAIRLCILGAVYQLGGAVGVMVIGGMLALPWLALMSQPVAVKLSASVAAGLVGFGLYGALALAFERSREET